MGHLEAREADRLVKRREGLGDRLRRPEVVAGTERMLRVEADTDTATPSRSPSRMEGEKIVVRPVFSRRVLRFTISPLPSGRGGTGGWGERNGSTFVNAVPGFTANPASFPLLNLTLRSSPSHHPMHSLSLLQLPLHFA